MSLSKRYAQNRIDLRNIKKEISNLLPDLEEAMAGADIDLQPYRQEFFSEDNYDNFTWPGWVTALEESESEYSESEMELAVLLDRKKKIISDCGDIKRLIYCEGVKIINSETKTNQGD